MAHRQHPSTGAWPVDPDVTSDDLAYVRHGEATVDLRRVGVVLAGGFVGGLARYEAVTHWAAPSGSFPWSTFAVNTAGAFILGLLLIVVLEVMGPSTYTRPLVGAGFCGSLTTFSSVAVAVDELAAHGHLLLGCGYLAASLVAGLAAAAGGALVGRRLPRTAERRALDDGGA
ncbi:MAG TPA: CrcB family protein [Mycobacteriales bacterium]|nr:CrcB family protein [Mycobacteriales bacterium]